MRCHVVSCNRANFATSDRFILRLALWQSPSYVQMTYRLPNAQIRLSALCFASTSPPPGDRTSTAQCGYPCVLLQRTALQSIVFLYFLNLSRFTTVVRGLLTLPLMLHLRGVTIWYVGRHFAALTGYGFALTTDTQRTVPMIPYNQTETSENRKKKNDETGLLL
jgi:hypothetical protein